MRVSKEVRRMIQLNNIYKTFHKGTVNEKKALNGLNLQMKKGDFVTKSHSIEIGENYGYRT